APLGHGLGLLTGVLDPLELGGGRSRLVALGTLGAIGAIAAGTAVVAVAVATAATLGGDPVGVGQERHLAGVLDRLGDLALLLGVVAGHPPGTDLGPIRHEATQQVGVLPVDVDHLLAVEDGHLLLDAAARVLGLAPLLLWLGHQNGSSLSS